MNRIHQIVAGCLALCVAFAGAVGVSPLLHQLVEHGGRGPAHAHSGASVRAAEKSVRHDHGGGAVHEHPRAPLAGKHVRPNHAVAYHHEFKLPKIPLSRLLRVAASLVENGTPASPKPASSNDGPGHAHHSLPQMLAGGLVELHVDLPLLHFIWIPTSFRAAPADAFPHLRDWEAQTASRAPPVSQS